MTWQYNKRDERFYIDSLNAELAKSQTSARVFEQFWVGRSRADVLVSTESYIRVYEIKSDRDTLARLPSQLSNYYKGSDLVTVFTGECHVEKLLNVLQAVECGPMVGVIMLNDSNQIETLQEAGSYTRELDHDTLFKMLRKQEYIDLLQHAFGTVPNAPPVFFFSECFKQFRSIPITEAYRMVAERLSCRR